MSSGETIQNNKPGAKIETKMILVTPKLAEATLIENEGNRKLNPARVDMFVRLIKAGLFRFSHQGIALDENGKLIDGQHRLAAIVKSKCSVWMLVTKGLPRESTIVIDNHQKRSFTQHMAMIGRIETEKDVAIARILEFGAKGSSDFNLPPEFALSLVEKYNGGINFVRSLGYAKYLIAPIKAVLARAYYTRDQKVLERFFEVFKTNTAANPSEVAAIKLRTVSIERPVRSAHSFTASGEQRLNTRDYLYWVSESALIDFINGYPTKTLLPTKNEKFPLPAHLQPEKNIK